MWICDATGFFSIVKKDCGDDELLVKARKAEADWKGGEGARKIKEEERQGTDQAEALVDHIPFPFLYTIFLFLFL